MTRAAVRAYKVHTSAPVHARVAAALVDVNLTVPTRPAYFCKQIDDN